MAKKSSIKVRLVPEKKVDSSFYYYVKKPTKGEKAKIKLKARKISITKSTINRAVQMINKTNQLNKHFLHILYYAFLILSFVSYLHVL